MIQEQIENNTLIAEFMGWDSKGTYSFLHKDTQVINVSSLCYHSSWDWLMTVVDKIESLDECSYKIHLSYAIGFINDHSLHGNPNIIRGIGSTRIETAYNLVINFIKWYNQQSK